LGQHLDVSEETDNLILQQGIPRCFNCGDPDHKVSACPLPANRQLIALSRQYYQIFQGSIGPQWQRIHTFESRRQQRLDWLDEFHPGEIRGELLQDALAESNEEWLKTICAWGYPPGWISDDDPRNRVRARIWNEYDCGNDSSEVFEIHGDDDVEAVPILINNGAEEDGSAISDNQDEKSLDKQVLDSESIHNSTPMKRWAKYPIRYFSSDFLFPYTPAKLSLPPPSWDDTSFIDTKAYLCQHDRSFSRPPSPSGAPPPLPPETPAAVPPLPLSKQHFSSLLDSESDMEMSDSE
jgi:zinc finger CCHC domain-containing protein 8